MRRIAKDRNEPPTLTISSPEPDEACEGGFLVNAYAHDFDGIAAFSFSLKIPGGGIWNHPQRLLGDLLGRVLQTEGVHLWAPISSDFPVGAYFIRIEATDTRHRRAKSDWIPFTVVA